MLVTQEHLHGIPTRSVGTRLQSGYFLPPLAQLCCLIQEQRDQGIEPIYRKEPKPKAKTPAIADSG
jgi:hypothetical protein